MKVGIHRLKELKALVDLVKQLIIAPHTKIFIVHEPQITKNNCEIDFIETWN